MHKNQLLQLLIIFILLTLFLVACDTTATDTTKANLEPTTPSTLVDSSESQVEAVLIANDHAESAVATDATDEINRPAGWNDETHSKEADPNYEIVFPENEVNTLTITITPDNWQAMLDDMTATYGEMGRNSRPGEQGVADQIRPEGRPEPPPQGGPGGDRPAGPGPDDLQGDI